MALTEDLEICQILVKLMPHLPKAKDALQIMVEEFERSSIINSGNIRAVLKQLYSYNSNELFLENFQVNDSPCQKSIEKFIFSLLTLFDMHKCSDKSVIADVLELLCLTRYSIYAMDKITKWVEIRCNENNGQTPMSTFEKTLVFSYKDIPSLVSPLSVCEAVHWNWIEILTSDAKVDALKVIISYGATLIVPQQVRFEYTLIVLLIFIRLLTPEELRAKYGTTLSIIQRILHNYKNKFDERSKRRLYFVNTFLKIFRVPASRTISDDYIQCTKIFINSTPEPLITSAEIKSVLTKLCSGIVQNDQILRFLEVYESHFPESREASTPRSLKHLSRFQVRESLRTARSFPYGVKWLGVPKKIQDLICFKDILQ